MQLKVSWSILKSFLATRKVSVQSIEFDDKYFIFAVDGPLTVYLELNKSPSDTTDLDEFIASYLPKANQAPNRYDTIDDDGTPLVRLKYASKGYTMHLRAIEFTTSTLNSLLNDSYDGTSHSDVVMKFYNASGTELTTQQDITDYCVKTIVDFEPVHNQDVIGGSITAKSAVGSDLRVWVIAAPDISYALGGSRVLINQENLAFYPEKTPIQVDGRTSKRLTYSATYHTNKLRVVAKHAAGLAVPLKFSLEYYKQ